MAFTLLESSGTAEITSLRSTDPLLHHAMHSLGKLCLVQVPPLDEHTDKCVCFPAVLYFDCCFSLSAEPAIPICAKDISDDLMKEFAFLSGEYQNTSRISLCGN